MQSITRKFTEGLTRAIQVKLSKTVTVILRHHLADDLHILIYLFSAWLFFHVIKWNLVEDMMIVVSVSITVDLAYAFQEETPAFLRIINVCVFFFFAQGLTSLVPDKIMTRLLGNLQYLIVEKILGVLNAVFDKDFLTVWITCAFLLILCFLFQIQNKDFVRLLQMTLIQITQNLITNSIPAIFQIPSLLIVMYCMQVVTRCFPFTAVVDDFIVYATAVGIQEQIYKWFPGGSEICIFLSLIGFVFAQSAKLHKSSELIQTLIVLVVIDWFMNVLKPMYTADPFICLFIFLFTIKIFTLLLFKD